MEKITYKIEEGYDTEYNFYLDGEWFAVGRDIPYESADGWAMVNLLEKLEEKGVIELEQIK